MLLWRVLNTYSEFLVMYIFLIRFILGFHIGGLFNFLHNIVVRGGIYIRCIYKVHI